jgi:hypothetical protein
MPLPYFTYQKPKDIVDQPGHYRCKSPVMWEELQRAWDEIDRLELEKGVTDDQIRRMGIQNIALEDVAVEICQKKLSWKVARKRLNDVIDEKY